MAEYIERRGAGLYVAGTRVSLDSVVHAFLLGESPEGIIESYPSLTLEQVFGSLAWYQRNRDETDRYLTTDSLQFQTERVELQRLHPVLSRHLAEAKHSAPTSR